MIDRTKLTTRSPDRRKAATWVVLFALLFNLAAGYVLPSTAQGALAEFPVDLSSGTLVICTPNGLRVIGLGPDGEPLPNQPQRDANCIYCLPFNAGQTGALDAQTTELISLSSAVRISYPAYSQPTSSSGSLDSHPIRAPPVF